jgi:hypothetical protein
VVAKFYHVLAYKEDITGGVAPGSAEYQPAYLGRTTDLLMKTEPEKSVDLDDGGRLVGSEKLTLSFSTLERVPRLGFSITKILLVPVQPATTAQPPAGLDAVLVEVGEVKITPVETKTGEFERTQFSAVVRYPVETPAYEILRDYYIGRQVHLIHGVHDSQRIQLFGESEGDTPELIACSEPGNFIASGHRALIPIDLGYDGLKLYINKKPVKDCDPLLQGVIIHYFNG